MKQITVLFYTGDDLISKLIKNVTKSEMTHVSIQIDKWTICEARLGKKSGLSFIKDYQNVCKRVEIFVDEETYDNVVKQILHEIDKPYDIKDLIWFIFPFIKGDKKKQICTEFVYNCLLPIGIEYISKPMSPSELYYKLHDYKFE